MLKLRSICKNYKIGRESKVILNNITQDFKRGELVFILGASGSGKSTLLNIMAGNLKCDSGEIWFNDECVSSFNDRKLNNYRNNIVGCIFQDYNLIEYMNVWDNIMIGYNGEMAKENINILLEQLGIYNKKKVVINKLSGGEKQRVAIARALVNNPDVILADEPTGALDSKTSLEVMDILRRISQNKIVIVVSHDNYLANKYASRIIKIVDGKCEYYPIVSTEEVNKKKKYRKFRTIKLALKNLWLKKMRTIFTSLAVSLGIIGMFSVSNLYNNFNKEIVVLEKDIVSLFPISINDSEYEIMDNDIKKSENKIIIKDRKKWIHRNNITLKYIDYLENIAEIKYLIYDYDLSLPLVSDRYKTIDNDYFKIIPSNEYIANNYEIIYGKNITNMNEILLKVDKNNNVDSRLLDYFNIDYDIDYEDIVGRRVRVILNDEYFISNGEYYIINNDNNKLYSNSNMELTIVGIIREKREVDNNNYLYGSSKLLDKVFDKNKSSKIVISQLNKKENVLGIDMERSKMLSYLGYNSLPSEIDIYVDSTKDKEKVIKLLDEYNNKNEDIVYVDMMNEAISMVKKFIMIISAILILFSVIAIIISSMMIGILTNVRVLERKKEIGILRSLGSSKKGIRKLFNVENNVILIIALLISIVVVNLLKGPINMIMDNYFDIQNMFAIKYEILLIVFIINMIIIKIVSIVPCIKASRMEIVKCIYNIN